VYGNHTKNRRVTPIRSQRNPKGTITIPVTVFVIYSDWLKKFLYKETAKHLFFFIKP
jgi:hypothetical protein